MAAPSWLTTDYLQKMLQNFFGDNLIALKNYKLSSDSAVGSNYIGQINRIELEYTNKNQVEKRNIVSKVVLESSVIKEFKKHFDHCATEMKMMEILPLLYKELCDKGEKEPFFPLIYHFDIQNKAIFMEDLNAKGYILADRKSSLDLDHTLLVIRELAKMHASSVLLFRKDPSLKNKFMDIFWTKSQGLFPGAVLNAAFSYLLNNLHLWPISQEDKEIFRSFDEKMTDLMTEATKRKESNFNALLHGDCWSSNLMFKYKNEKVESVKLLDYQLSSYNSIGLDLNFFLFTSASTSVKIDHLEDVFKAYYDSFVKISGQVDGFNVDAVRKEFLKTLGFGFVLATVMRFILTSEKGFDLDAYLKGIECPANNEIFQREEIISETVKMLPIFKKHGIFKFK